MCLLPNLTAIAQDVLCSPALLGLKARCRGVWVVFMSAEHKLESIAKRLSIGKTSTLSIGYFLG